jgi:hypothetical protein
MPTITTAAEVYHVRSSQLDQVLELLAELDSPESDGVRITVPRPRIQASAPLATEADVRNQIELGGPINDSAALSIAAWYASARGAGQTFHELATGRAVPVDELLDAIQAEIDTAPRNTLTVSAGDLDALARWVEQSTDEN